MQTIKISDAEYPLMEYIWEHAPLPAAQLAAYALDAFGWKKNTTYTVIKRLIERGAIERQEPGFIVSLLVSREEVQRAEVGGLIDRVFGGSTQMFLTTFLRKENLTDAELQILQEAIDQAERKRGEQK